MDLTEKKKEEVRDLCGKAIQAEKSCLSSVIRAGEALLGLKDIAPHGEFMPLVRSFGVSQRQANRYMEAARMFISRGDDLENLPDVSIKEYIDLKSTRTASGQFLVVNSGGPGRGFKAPPKDPAAEPKQYIYAVINPLMVGWVKVGMSDNPRRRLKDMQTYSPADYELVFKAELPEGFKDHTIHPFLSANFNSVREWFECPADDAIDIIESLLENIIDRRSAA